MKKQKVTYKTAGVDYHAWDFAKKLAQQEGAKTAANISGLHLKEQKESRGESAYLIEAADCYYALVEEGLGTKNLIADEMYTVTGKTYYDSIAQDTIAMMVNDLITVGARPVSILAYWAIGNSQWFQDKKRTADLIRGWRHACDLSGATWGGGETPTQKDLLRPEVIELAGAAFGMIKPKKRLVLGKKLAAGDAIILIESSGIHANGLTLARKIADMLPKRYATPIDNGAMYGEELLKPTHIYSRLIQTLLDKKVDIHYMANITGHGWRKLMRSPKQLRYRIDTVPPVSPVFTFLQQKSRLDDSEMYGTFNMGAGFALFVSSPDASSTVQLAHKAGFKAWIAGSVEKGPRSVEIKPLGIIYNEKELDIR